MSWKCSLMENGCKCWDVELYIKQCSIGVEEVTRGDGLQDWAYKDSQ